MRLEGFPQNVVLHDGTAVAIKPLDAEEASAVLKFYRSLPEEDRLFLRDDVTKPEWLRRFVARIESGEIVSLVAEAGGKIVGEGTLYRAQHGWTKHVAELRIAVAPTLRRGGLGSTLARELVKIATRTGVEKMVIQVVENQVGARKMFRKLGFRQEAVLRGHVKDIHGSKRDLIVAANDISHIWDAMESLVSDFSPSLE
ncbi:MAG TPA: GNAT family N-acetyltransferase [Thermoanaerobaculaceae bacterium]|nr:GNAT family N-acetyltransferase [Thermoanaerobaculaceae bacterium]